MQRSVLLATQSLHRVDRGQRNAQVGVRLTMAVSKLHDSCFYGEFANGRYCVGLSGLLQRKWRADRGSMSHGSHYASPPGLRSRNLGSMSDGCHLTSNRPLEDWGKLIGDIPSATAILDRFLHRSELFQLTGRSYRLGTSENNPKGAKAPTGSEADKKVEDKAPKGAKA
jgi:hypothetical protein